MKIETLFICVIKRN